MLFDFFESSCLVFLFVKLFQGGSTCLRNKGCLIGFCSSNWVVSGRFGWV